MSFRLDDEKYLYQFISEMLSKYKNWCRINIVIKLEKRSEQHMTELTFDPGASKDHSIKGKLMSEVVSILNK